MSVCLLCVCVCVYVCVYLYVYWCTHVFEYAGHLPIQDKGNWIYNDGDDGDDDDDDDSGGGGGGGGDNDGDNDGTDGDDDDGDGDDDDDDNDDNDDEDDGGVDTPAYSAETKICSGPSIPSAKSHHPNGMYSKNVLYFNDGYVKRWPEFESLQRSSSSIKEISNIAVFGVLS